MAEQFREEHRLGVQPLGDLVALIEQSTGHDVAVLDAEPDEHGLTMRDPVRDRVFIGVARTPHPMRQRSTLAHELAHLIFGDHAQDLAERSPAEKRADAFARHLLVPQEGLREFLGVVAKATESTLSDVVQRFLVSPAIAAIAMRDASYISPDTVSEWKDLYTPELATRFGWQDQYRSLQEDSQRLRAPQSLVARANAGYAAGVVSAQTIATLRGVSEEQVVKELYEVGLAPRSPAEADFEVEDLPTVTVDLTGLEDDGEDA
ncbi:ImmA/IrrE family metallo-endopeptidase [Citricoccus sp. NR2]|uniref:ImmA/IrrE family metallo-endopeptidase n=1 Tax=Citricoccus sp. NR2 TaxID=3004095 RepID=UPI0022DE6DB6|nr:ImmA/IrrE family metallo-endopeptidase [Citricoccus sp. NR2]WBL19826.1 ImmA/IrrE family metallo-endopeptidase [Citricoccus sp. NR2]